MQRLFPFQGWRLTFFQAIIFAVFCLFAVRMYQLQVLNFGESQARVDENRLSELPIAANRGVMTDRYGRPLAINVPAFNVTVIPAALPDSQDETLRIYNRLSALTGVPPTRAIADASGQAVRSIEELVDEGEGIAPYRAVIIAQDIPQRSAMQLLEERYSLPGVDVQAVAVREYPTGELTSQIIGYMGPISPEQQLELLELGYNPAYDRIGYAGMEYSLETQLAGQRGREVNEVDVAGAVVNNIETLDPVAGLNVQLTIDTELQQAAEEALREQIDRLNAERGAIVSETGVVIAMNPQTGEVLAMVSYPSYDNQRFARAIDGEYYFDLAEDPLTPLVNHATQSIYPPGSVWKLITAAGVLQEDIIDPMSRLVDPGELILPNRYAPNDQTRGQRFVCWLDQGHGALNILGAIAQSCDVYFYQVGGGNPEVSPAVLRDNGLGIDGLFRYATAFGIGSQLGIELPFENAHRMVDADWKRRRYGEQWSTGDTYNVAFGQGYLNVTPLQLLTSVTAFANGGTLYQPTVIRQFTDAEGNLVEDFEPEVLRNVNLDLAPSNEPIRLMLLEDMIMQGENSLSCTCEPDSEFYDPLRCDPPNYTSQVNVNSDPMGMPVMREYSVHLPLDYEFGDGFCDEIRFNDEYRPAFVSTENIGYVQTGMRLTVTDGTAQSSNLTYVEVAGKTGTAEYCDEIANRLNLCRPGNWPAHAWYTAYAPYQNPEIAIIGFVYNGGEGSAVALPIVVNTLEAYFRLQNDRALQAGQPSVPQTTLPEADALVSTPVSPAPSTVDPAPVSGG